MVWMSLRLWAVSKADLAVGSLFGGATHAVPHSHGPGGHRASSLWPDVGLASPGRLRGLSNPRRVTSPFILFTPLLRPPLLGAQEVALESSPRRWGGAVVGAARAGQGGPGQVVLESHAGGLPGAEGQTCAAGGSGAEESGLRGRVRARLESCQVRSGGSQAGGQQGAGGLAKGRGGSGHRFRGRWHSEVVSVASSDPQPPSEPLA